MIGATKALFKLKFAYLEFSINIVKNAYENRIKYNNMSTEMPV